MLKNGGAKAKLAERSFTRSPRTQRCTPRAGNGSRRQEGCIGRQQAPRPSGLPSRSGAHKQGAGRNSPGLETRAARHLTFQGVSVWFAGKSASRFREDVGTLDCIAALGSLVSPIRDGVPGRGASAMGTKLRP